MTPEAFVAVAAGLARVKAKTVLGAVRLAVGDATFATVGRPSADWAVVKLAPTDQAVLVGACSALVPEPGRRGAKGVTLVRLRAVDEAVAGRVLLAAWRNATTPSATFAKAG